MEHGQNMILEQLGHHKILEELDLDKIVDRHHLYSHLELPLKLPFRRVHPVQAVILLFLMDFVKSLTD